MNSDQRRKTLELLTAGEVERKDFLSSGRLLVHYTRNPREIFAAQELWLRNARNMSDQEEIYLGRKCVDQFLNQNETLLRSALEAISPGMYDSLVNCWTSEFDAQVEQSFIGCFTTANAEDSGGSTEHWNNYGHAAIYLKPDFLKSEPSHLSLYLVKVIYGAQNIMSGLRKLLEILHNSRDFLATADPAIIQSILRHQLFYFAVASKSEIYSWEREWRLIHVPYIFASADMQPENRSVKGKEEVVFPLKLRNTPAGYFPDLDVKNLVGKVLIKDSVQINASDLKLQLESQLIYLGTPKSKTNVFILEK